MNKSSSRVWRKWGEASQQRRMEGVGSSSPGSLPFLGGDQLLKDFKMHPKWSLCAILSPFSILPGGCRRNTHQTLPQRTIDCKNVAENVFFLNFESLGPNVLLLFFQTSQVLKIFVFWTYEMHTNPFSRSSQFLSGIFGKKFFNSSLLTQINDDLPSSQQTKSERCKNTCLRVATEDTEFL